MVNKFRTTISIDLGLINMAKQKGLNVSGLCEDHLREILKNYEQSTLPENCQHKWTWPFCTPFSLAKECLKCGSFKKVKIE